MLKPDISELKLEKLSELKPDISKRRPDINILLVLYVAILVALGALGVAKTGVVFAKTALVQTTTSPGVKVVDGFAAQSK